jgi:hypothetical protein
MVEGSEIELAIDDGEVRAVNEREELRPWPSRCGGRACWAPGRQGLAETRARLGFGFNSCAHQRMSAAEQPSYGSEMQYDGRCGPRQVLHECEVRTGKRAFARRNRWRGPGHGRQAAATRPAQPGLGHIGAR